jgi:hypothetical protein
MAEGGQFSRVLHLETVDIKITIMVTVDAANGPLSDFVDRQIDPNVEHNENFYENDPKVRRLPGSHGENNEAVPHSRENKRVNNHNMSKGTYLGMPIDHYNIDDATMEDTIQLFKQYLGG